ncbi:MAG: hypothetical protein LBM17_03765 [Candidatus Accumulibacter sp.]|jgi:hypothetical protein|nr:hypothetical protein [Accumulibacter sp.]
MLRRLEMNEKELIERDKNRDIGTELLEAIRQINAGNWSRKTTFELQEDGSVLHRVVTPDGTMERETRIRLRRRVGENLSTTHRLG